MYSEDEYWPLWFEEAWYFAMKDTVKEMLHELLEKVKFHIERWLQQLILEELQHYRLAPKFCDQCGKPIRFDDSANEVIS